MQVYFYRPQTKFSKVIFLHVSVCPQGASMAGGVHGRRACMVGGKCGRGQGACMTWEVWGAAWQGGAWQGGAWQGGHAWWGRGHVWQRGPGGCTAGGHVWQGVCGRGCMAGGMHGGGHVWPGHAPLPRHRGYYEIRSMSGRYASYWNAFLLILIFISNSNQ